MSPNTVVINAETRHEIESLIHEHAWRIDQNQADRLHELYSENGRMVGVGMEHIGREAIAKYGAQRVKLTNRSARHVCSNLRITPLEDGRIRGNFIITLYRHEGDGIGTASPVAVADITDTYSRQSDQKLLIDERLIALTFESEAHRKS